MIDNLYPYSIFPFFILVCEIPFRHKNKINCKPISITSYRGSEPIAEELSLVYKFSCVQCVFFSNILYIQRTSFFLPGIFNFICLTWWRSYKLFFAGLFLTVVRSSATSFSRDREFLFLQKDMLVTAELSQKFQFSKKKIFQRKIQEICWKGGPFWIFSSFDRQLFSVEYISVMSKYLMESTLRGNFFLA